MPVRMGKIPAAGTISHEESGRQRRRRTLRDDFPAEHDGEDDPEQAHTLRGHLLVIVQRLEQVGDID